MAAPMASDSGLRRLFEKPLPENPTLLEALSAWNRHTHPNKPIDPSSFTEIFGELHFQEKQPERAAAPPAPASWLDIAAAAEAEKSKDDSSLDALLRPKPAASAMATGVKRSASFCLKKSSASLLLCTEGLGSESTVDADDMFKDGDAEAEAAALEGTGTGGGDGDAAAGDAEAMKGEEVEERQPKTFPPPIRSIGRGGKPYVCFRSFREDGRFVLLEVVIPGKELLQATREGGRLRLQFANAAAAAGAGIDEAMHGEDDDHHQAAKSACIDDDDES
ncbi:protein FANTASTIC FOUR 3-like [Panicum virgatum]|uniref:FAF domain-containing protein n=1 Tax=Panicum virgatum TaxID=38727 RepID=A0A8T0PE28_PANVG|nr:protein FANTASTIC FOUR 3-like [Panicum virgatum]XP_039775936.1 protein FANTASTIC FOUR 3-like [Panicum virgatum]XP_039775937.1 protein FANTASTIC FOUR 3-like [Panicum virgatum]XP_039775938.1 protein FANTASTIC FOUR 3-like [Panicum virgatum]XP_039775939.1 protein FANTASTIC FOUR 3-like [Panicum virgatum]XP_039775940.1 protein FANTASTIC FOUR 3-like [Panicum virgatum]XP_039775941.1 protein FANTASTIC FOUR 3-like [Panicum virgatum]XP_039775942.1 protein FANTASTIC FOUR 3-like [Panicum virgatum]KAG